MRHLKQLVSDKEINGKIVMAGFRHPVLPYVGAADFGILPSVVQEGCPLSPQEYMSQGRPVIATNHGGQREYMSQGRNGLLVEPGNEEQLAEAMRSLISNPSMRERLGKQAKADFEAGMNYESFYQKIQVLYQ
jgi:glycosyltransferase involved in cell wall biosynthesis